MFWVRCGSGCVFSYCVAGDKLTVTPKPASPTLTGTIVMQKSGGSGSGGTAGGAGNTGAGGQAGQPGGAGGTSVRDGGADAPQGNRRRLHGRDGWRRWYDGDG
jgi:hypothetical protein